MQVLDARLGDVYTGGDGGSSPAGGAVDATVAPSGGGAEANSHDQRASFDSDTAVQVHSSAFRIAAHLLVLCALALDLSHDIGLLDEHASSLAAVWHTANCGRKHGHAGVLIGEQIRVLQVNQV